ncbi:hypothetical protein AB0J82_36935 [Asanoa sp. NPDC049518]
MTDAGDYRHGESLNPLLLAGFLVLVTGHVTLLVYDTFADR